MRIAVPVVGERFSEHFGRSDGFFLCEVDVASNTLTQPRVLRRPRKKCESLPQWLRELRVDVVLAGGIGPVGRGHLEERGIHVLAGFKADAPRQVVEAFLSGAAEGRNPCGEFEHRYHHCRAAFGRVAEGRSDNGEGGIRTPGTV